jgi:hypothetical protein
MALVQRDYILRMIEAVAAALARILRRRQEGDLAGARREVDMASSELLGPIAGLASRVDTQTAGNLLGDGRRIATWARLLAEDSEILREMGRSDEGDANDRRVLELLLEAWLRDGSLDPDSLALMDVVRGRLPQDAMAMIAPRYRDALTSLDRA